MNTSQAILVFLKAPEPGNVKTRLSKDIGAELSVSFYKNFVLDLLETVDTLNLPTCICFYPPEKEKAVISWLGNSYSYWAQDGNHLGQRMENAFFRAFKTGIKQAVLIGTDIPDLPRYILKGAFDALQTHNAVIGPSKDGGYYLIGFNATGFLPAVFNDIPWGQPEVFTRTMAVFDRYNVSVHVSPLWEDIDEIQDLLSFITRSGANRNTGRRTAALITKSIRFPLFTSMIPRAMIQTYVVNGTSQLERTPEMTTPSVKLYSLSTCGHCKSAKKFLGDCTIKYDFVDVDLLEGEERKAILEDVKKFNPKCSFPTIIIGNTVVVGFKENEIKEALGL